MAKALERASSSQLGDAYAELQDVWEKMISTFFAVKNMNLLFIGDCSDVEDRCLAGGCGALSCSTYL